MELNYIIMAGGGVKSEMGRVVDLDMPEHAGEILQGCSFNSGFSLLLESCSSWLLPF
jgi:hypothetical protein